MMYNGLNVRDGRLVNDRPCGTIGIQAAAQARKERKRQEKINMMSEAYSRAESRESGIEILSIMPMRKPY